MTRKILVACLCVLIAAGLFACGSNDSDPIANAGTDQNVVTGSLVTLDGSASDGDGELLTYNWSFVSTPPGSNATLSDAAVVRPTFTADVDGVYVVQLVVNDSNTDTVTITAATTNSAPVANAGADQNVTTGNLVTLDGSASSDANGDLLSYSWSFVSRPALSNAALSAATVVGPTFTADVDGGYVLQLVVNDGALDSAADTVTITATTANSAPTAHAGQDQSVNAGTLVTLDGSASNDANGDPLSYSWSFVSVPSGSALTQLTGPETAAPSFTPDVRGDYLVRLIVNDSQADSAPDNVLVTVAGWDSPVLFSGLHQGFQNARLVVDAVEEYLLAWSTSNHVWASSSSGGVNWSSPEQVDDASLRAGLTDVAMNASGRAALVWRSEETTPADYFKARLYSPLAGWETSSQFLDALSVDGTGGAVDINDTGDVMAVFARYGTGDHVWARSYTETSGWDAAATPLDTPPSWSNYPDVAVDSSGNATVVWEQWDGTSTQPFARSYVAGTGWDAAPTALNSPGDPSIEKIRIALGADGNGLAHWTLADRSGVTARRLVGGNFQPFESVATGTGIYTSDAQIAPDGRIVQTWADDKNVYAKTCLNAIYDDTATLVSDDNESVHLRSSVMAMDRSNGRVIVMWSRLALNDADGSAVWARRYDPAEGWSSVEQVLPWTPGILFDVDDAVLLDDGRALAVLAGEDVSVWEYSTYLIRFH